MIRGDNAMCSGAPLSLKPFFFGSFLIQQGQAGEQHLQVISNINTPCRITKLPQIYPQLYDCSQKHFKDSEKAFNSKFSFRVWSGLYGLPDWSGLWNSLQAVKGGGSLPPVPPPSTRAGCCSLVGHPRGCCPSHRHQRRVLHLRLNQGYPANEREVLGVADQILGSSGTADLAERQANASISSSSSFWAIAWSNKSQKSHVLSSPCPSQLMGFSKPAK